MDGDEPRPSVLDVVCYAPLGLVHVATEELPKLARQRRQASENRIQLARWIGQIAVQQANRELRLRWSAVQASRTADTPAASVDEVVTVGWSPDAPRLVDPAAAGSAEPIEPCEPPEGEPPEGELPEGEPAGAVDLASPDAVVPSVDELPIAGYESLAAQQVVQRLATLSAEERETIRRFEAAHRHRRTILAKLDQLQAG